MSSFSRGASCVRALPLDLPSRRQRARGMPGAGRTHGPPAEKSAGGRYHEFSRDIPAFPAQWLERLLRVLPGAPGFLATVPRQRAEARCAGDTSVGISGPRDFTVREMPARLAGLRSHRIPHPTYRDDAYAPRTEAGRGQYALFLKKRKTNFCERGSEIGTTSLLVCESGSIVPHSEIGTARRADQRSVIRRFLSGDQLAGYANAN